MIVVVIDAGEGGTCASDLVAASSMSFCLCALHRVIGLLLLLLLLLLMLLPVLFILVVVLKVCVSCLYLYPRVGV